MNLLHKFLAKDLPFVFYAPAMLWQFVFLYIPFMILVTYSLIDFNPELGRYAFTLAYYIEVFNSLYIQIIMHSFILALCTAVCCFIIAYPVAYYLAMKGPKRFKAFMLFSIILPSWTSLIVQAYAWFFLLEKKGIISVLLQKLGIISPHVHLLNNYFAILLGTVSCYLPFMILPIYAVLERMDKRLTEASADLGADRFETFRRIVFPMSLPGVYAGLFLVFIPSFGEYAIPTLLGGSKYIFWGNVIVDKFLRSANWRVGSTLVVVGVMFPVLTMLLGYGLRQLITYFKTRQARAAQAVASSKDLWD
jgi:spermidine/putrescine transport system permease protein